MLENHRYRWIIAFTLFGVYALETGMGNNTGSLYMVPVTGHYGFSRGDFSLMFTIITATNALFQLVYGWLARRIGVRSIMITGVTLAPLGYLVFANATSLPVFYAGAVIFGASLAFSALTSISVLVNNWFDKDQGIVLGFIAAGSGVGGAIFSLVIGNEIAGNGFQSAYWLATGLLVIPILPVVLLIRSGPPVESPASSTAHRIPAGPPPIPLNNRQFFGNSTLMLGILAVFLLGATIHPVSTNTPAYMVEKGYSQVFAASIYSGLLLVLAAAKIGLGFLHDRLGLRASLMVGLISFLFAASLLIFATDDWLIWAFVFFDGIALASLSILVPLFARSLLGRDNYSSYLGFYMAILHIGASAGMPAMNYSFDFFGTYTWYTAVCIGIVFTALILINSLLNKNRITRQMNGTNNSKAGY